MFTQRAVCPVVHVFAPLVLAALASACTAPVGDEPANSSNEALIVRPPIPIELAPSPTYYAAGPNQTVQMASFAGNLCMLQSVSGSFDYLNMPAVHLYAENGSYWLSAGVNTSVSAVCVNWGGFSGATLTSNLFLSTQIVANAGTNQSITGYKQLTLDSNPGDACFLWGIHGDWLTNEREPSGVYGRVNGAWVFPNGGVQDFEVLTNGMGAGGDAFCYSRPGGKAFQQGSYTATYLGPRSVQLPSTATAICGLTGIQGGFDNWNDVAEIVQGPGGSQTLEVNYDSQDYYLWASATCLPYSQ